MEGEGKRIRGRGREVKGKGKPLDLADGYKRSVRFVHDQARSEGGPGAPLAPAFDFEQAYSVTVADTVKI